MRTTSSHYNYDAYIDASEKIHNHFDEKYQNETSLLNKCDWTLSFHTDYFKNYDGAFSLALNAHSLFLAATKMAKSGHDIAVYPLLRTAMESATYAILLTQDENLYSIWIKRHESENCFKQSKKAFTPAMKRLRKILHDYDENSGCSPYEEYIMSMYDAVIDFGAHPNPITITNNTTIIQDETYRFEYLNNFNLQMMKSILACIEIGTILSIIMYLPQILKEPSAENLDSKFMGRILEINALSDQINGAPLGYEKQYYSQINSYTK